MSLFITSLNSGSNGNSYYVGNKNEAVLIDAGIPCSEIETRMSRLGLEINKVKAVFISHEHTDHISGVAGLAKKYKIPVYISIATLIKTRVKLDKKLVFSFIASEPVLIGDLVITAFSKFHDACDPYSFIVSHNHINIGIFTDIGIACTNVITHFKRCNAAFLESNYDEAMLDKGSYPYLLKSRIRGGKGHLSNRQALDLFIKHRPSFMSHLFLSHLSKNNNCPELVYDLFNKHANGTKIIITSRDNETAVYEISTPYTISNKVYRKKIDTSQLSFSFA